jgi:serine/threonine-protein kinase
LSDNLVGRKIGHYELHEVIGRGGMAVVYRAAQPRIDRDVAIKIIAAPYARHPQFILRFEQEMRATVRLQHPHILPVYDVSLDGGELYMVMAFLTGGTLARRVGASARGLSLEDTICVVSQIASALDYAHAQGIVHRDVKPGNILLDGHGNAYLGDFGIAQLAETETPPRLGTFAYMAPELLMGKPATPASDIYSLGVVAFEMLTRRRPFEAHDRASLLTLHAQIGIPDIRPLRPDLPPGLQVALAQALAEAPDGRPPHASSLAQALLRASGLSGLPCADTFDAQTLTDVSDQPPPAVAGDDWLDDDDAADARHDPRTPPPFADLGWLPDGPDTEPDQPDDSLPYSTLPPTQVGAPTAVPVPVSTSGDEYAHHAFGPALLLIWVGVVLVLLALAVLAVVLISRAGGPAG